MNNTFSIKRFWNYFVHDLNVARSDSGLTLAILGALPLFQFFFAQAFSLVFQGSFITMGPMGKIPAYIVAVFIAIIFFPAKHYGVITDRRKGSDWLMLPASSLEKWCSMLLLTCLVVPVLLFTELALTDGLLSLCFNSVYGETAIAGIVDTMGKVWGELRTAEGGIAICWPYALYLNWCESVLFFTLGAIWFKKSKIGKTFVAGFLIMMLVSLIGTGILSALHIQNLNMEFTEFSEAGFIRTMNIIIYSIYVVAFFVLDLLLYLRVKTLKH